MSFCVEEAAAQRTDNTQPVGMSWEPCECGEVSQPWLGDSERGQTHKRSAEMRFVTTEGHQTMAGLEVGRY